MSIIWQKIRSGVVLTYTWILFPLLSPSQVKGLLSRLVRYISGWISEKSQYDMDR